MEIARASPQNSWWTLSQNVLRLGMSVGFYRSSADLTTYIIVHSDRLGGLLVPVIELAVNDTLLVRLIRLLLVVLLN